MTMIAFDEKGWAKDRWDQESGTEAFESTQRQMSLPELASSRFIARYGGIG